MIFNFEREYRRVTNRLRGLEKLIQSQDTQDVHTASRLQNANRQLTSADIQKSQRFIEDIDARIDQILSTSGLLQQNTIEISPLALQVLNFKERKDLVEDTSATQCWQFRDLALFDVVGDWAIGTVEPVWIGNEYISTLEQLERTYTVKTGSSLVASKH